MNRTPVYRMPCDRPAIERWAQRGGGMPGTRARISRLRGGCICHLCLHPIGGRSRPGLLSHVGQICAKRKWWAAWESNPVPSVKSRLHLPGMLAAQPGGGLPQHVGRFRMDTPSGVQPRNQLGCNQSHPRGGFRCWRAKRHLPPRQGIVLTRTAWQRNTTSGARHWTGCTADAGFPVHWRFHGESNPDILLDREVSWALDDGTQENDCRSARPTSRIQASYTPTHYLGVLRLGNYRD